MKRIYITWLPLFILTLVASIQIQAMRRKPTTQPAEQTMRPLERMSESFKALPQDVQHIILAYIAGGSLEDGLRRAIETKDIKNLKLLLLAGANPNHMRSIAEPMLLTAVKQNQPEMVRSLIGAGARASGIERDLLSEAAKNHNLEIVDLLLAAPDMIIEDTDFEYILDQAIDEQVSQALNKKLGEAQKKYREKRMRAQER